MQERRKKEGRGQMGMQTMDGGGGGAGCHVQPAAAGAHGNKMETTAGFSQSKISHLINVGGKMIN